MNSVQEVISQKISLSLNYLAVVVKCLSNLDPYSVMNWPHIQYFLLSNSDAQFQKC